MCHKTKRIKRNEKDKDVMMHDSQQFINLLEEIQVVSFIAYFENTARALIKQDHLSWEGDYTLFSRAKSWQEVVVV